MPIHQLKELGHYIDLLLDAICVVDASGTFLYVSAGAERIFGYTPAEMIGHQVAEFVHPDDLERTLKTAKEIMAGQAKIDFSNRYLRKDGQIVHILWSARWSESEQFRVAVARDISRLKLAEARQSALYQISEAAHAAQNLSELYRLIHTIVANFLPAANFTILLPDPQTGLLQFTYQAALEADAILQAQAQIIEQARKVMLQQHTMSWQHGHFHWLSVPLHQQSQILGAMVVFGRQAYSEHEQEFLEFVSQQIAAAIERKKMHDRLQHIAFYDVLTGLPNRALFYDRLHTALKHARREQTQFAICYLDLDKFKQVNDQAGHANGDLLLQQVAERLQRAVRSGDTVSRFGGDEFVVLLDPIDGRTSAQQLAEKIKEAFRMAFQLEGFIFQVFPSIGIAVYPVAGDDEKILLIEADRAMYHAKKTGGHCIVMAPATDV